MEIEAPVLFEPGTPLRIETIELDDPQSREVRVRLTASGVCHSCLHVADGSHSGMPLPLVLGDEGAGIVESVGPGCLTLEPGDHVILSWAPGCGLCRQCLRDRPGLCTNEPTGGVLRDGRTRFHLRGDPIYHFGPSTYAPYVVVPERAAVKIRPEMPLEYAALIGCAVSTGVGAVVNTAAARPGESVVVIGCGGVGLSAIMGAALTGCNPIIAVDVLDHKLESARRLGATHAFPATTPELTEEIARLTGGGADYCLVAVGNTAAIEGAIDLIAPGGACLLIGAPPMGAKLSVDPFALITRGKRMIGVRYGSCAPARDFPRFVELHLAGKLKLEEMVSRRYRPAEVNEAMEALAAGNDTRGLIVFD